MPNLAHETIPILDISLSIAYANDNLLRLCRLERKNVIGVKIGDLECPGLDDSEIIHHPRSPPESGEFFKEIVVRHNGCGEYWR